MRIGMSLTIRQLELCNFRNYRHLLCDSLSDLNIFVGPNAVGKTNIVESIDLLTSISSFRNPKAAELVGPYERFARAEILAEGDNRFLRLDLHVSEGKKKYLLNGKEKAASRLRGMVPSVSFTPDDLMLIKGPNAPRRHAIDVLGAQLTANYSAIRKDFEQILRQKNNLLKDDPPRAFLDSIDETFVTCATQFYCYRVSLFEKLVPHINAYYQDIAQRDERVVGEYIPSWIASASATRADVSRETTPEAFPDPHDKERVRLLLQQTIAENRYRELSARRSLIGPHKDEIRFFIDGRNASVFGSQGQQRSLVLAWKLAEVRLVEEMLGKKPLLLLDDVMSELDEIRRRELTKYVLASTQTFITTTNLDYFAPEMLDCACVTHLEYRKESLS